MSHDREKTRGTDFEIPLAKHLYNFNRIFYRIFANCVELRKYSIQPLLNVL